MDGVQTRPKEHEKLNKICSGEWSKESELLRVVFVDMFHPPKKDSVHVFTICAVLKVCFEVTHMLYV